ncbi:MAG: hypothetical protein NTX43_14180 [Bacteroidetes bacterium]|nr:hypothetical protein [Bacteroidota bacterium]
MRKYIFITISSLTFSCLVLFSGCNTKSPTTGTLTVIVYDYKTNTIVPNELVYIASSYQNLRNHIWINSLYTDANGRAYFHDLAPILTFYDTEHWENYGAMQVYAGIDQTALLFVDNPLLLKK